MNVDSWKLADRTLTSRIIVGTGKYKSNEETRAALAAYGAANLTEALTREDLSHKLTHLHAIDRQ